MGFIFLNQVSATQSLSFKLEKDIFQILDCLKVPCFDGIQYGEMRQNVSCLEIWDMEFRFFVTFSASLRLSRDLPFVKGGRNQSTGTRQKTPLDPKSLALSHNFRLSTSLHIGDMLSFTLLSDELDGHC